MKEGQKRPGGRKVKKHFLKINHIIHLNFLESEPLMHGLTLAGSLFGCERRDCSAHRMSFLKLGAPLLACREVFAKLSIASKWQ